MNPFALILILGLGVVAFSTIANNKTDKRLSVKIESVDSIKISLAGLQFTCSLMINNPLERSLSYDTAIINTTINNTKFSQTQNPGGEIKKGDNMKIIIWVIAYDKIVPIIQALALNKLTNANVTLSIEINAGGYVGSAIKTIKLDTITKIKI